MNKKELLMNDLIGAVNGVLEWHDDNLSDGVNREYSIKVLRDALHSFQQSMQPTVESGRKSVILLGKNKMTKWKIPIYNGDGELGWIVVESPLMGVSLFIGGAQAVCECPEPRPNAYKSKIDPEEYSCEKCHRIRL